MKALVAAVLALVFAAPAAACAHSASESRLESELICPVCHETLDESDSPVAQDMKAYIKRRIAQCATEKQIIDEFVGPPNNFGDGILSTPRKHGFDLLAWVLPIGGAAGAAAALAFGARRWTRAGAQPDTGSLDPEMERRIDEELARFDG